MKNNTNSAFKRLSDIIPNTCMYDAGTSIFPSGFQTLDDITGGFKSGRLYLIGGRPAMGKTSLMLDMALNIASALNPVYIFSLESSETHIAEKLLYKTKICKNETMPEACTDDIEDFPIYICDKPMRFEIIKKTIEDELTEGIVFIDYLQLIDAQTDIHLSSYELTQKRLLISSAFKQLAAQKKLPIVITSQLSREIENRYDKRPRLYDVKYEGIVESSDTVIFIYRNAYYCPYINDTDAELIVAKNDNDQLGTAIVRYDQTHCLTFERI